MARRISFIASALSGVLLLLVPEPSSASLSARSPFEASVDLREENTYRIRKHLAKVEMELRLRTPPGLTPAQVEARARRLDDLRAYRQAGIFPVNPALTDTLHPVFIDALGTACAVGQLIIASGSRNLAEDIAAAQNHAYLPEIRDSRLPDWAADNGLTLEECARIQPGYPATAWNRVRALAVDSRQRPWVAAYGDMQYPEFGIGYRDGNSWNVARRGSGYRSLCLSGHDQAFAGGQDGAWWEGQEPGQKGTATWGCDWIGDSLVLAGTRNGILRFRTKAGGGMEQVDSLRIVPFADDTVRWVAHSGSIDYAASPSRLGIGYITGGIWTIVPSQELGGKITGMVMETGGGLWLGVDGVEKYSGLDASYSHFSSKGLRYRAPLGGWSTYSRAMSSLSFPIDTIFAVLPRRTGVLLIASPKGLYSFQRGVSPERLGDLGALQVTTLAEDSAGTVYLGTEDGLYTWRAGAAVRLGPLLNAGSPILSRQHPSRPAGPLSLLGWPAGREATALSLLGRRIMVHPEARPAAGRYVLPAAAP